MPVSDYDQTFLDAGREWNVDPTLLRAVAHQESGGQPALRSSAGAIGVMQIMPQTARELGVTDPTDPQQSIYGGAKYLSQMLDRYKKPELALAAYNAGPKRVDAYLAGRGALPAETQAYVPAVTAHYKRFSAPAPAGKAAAATPAGESDAAFLARTGGAGAGAAPSAPAAPEDDATFLARTGGAAPAPEPAAAPAASAELPGGGTVADFDRPVPAPPTMTLADLKNGLLVDDPAAGNILPLAGNAVDGTLRLAVPNSVRAMARGVRDLIQGPTTGTVTPEATMALMGGIGGVGMRSPLAANRLAAPVAADIPTMTVRPPPGALAGPDLPMAVKPGMGAPVARSAGAAATPIELTPMEAREARASQATGETQRLLAPAKAGQDTTQYVPGVKLTAAEVAGDAATSTKQRITAELNPEPFRLQQAANNEARIDHFAEAAGTPTIVSRMEEARSAQAQKDLDAAFGAKQATNAQPVVDTIKAILTNPRDSENTAVKSYVQPLLDRLTGADGALKSDPEQLYGLREDVNRLMSKSARAETPTLNHVTGQLSQVKDALDAVIEQGAPGYKQYLQNFANASKPIDEMTVLQSYLPKLTDVSGNMTLNRFHSMMKDIVSDRQAGGINPAKSISPATMERLFNIHADLKRLGNLNLGKAGGSDTFQKMAHAATSGAVHAGAAATMIPGANLIAHAALGKISGMAVNRRTRNMLNPDMGQGPLH